MSAQRMHVWWESAGTGRNISLITTLLQLIEGFLTNHGEDTIRKNLAPNQTEKKRRRLAEKWSMHQPFKVLAINTHMIAAATPIKTTLQKMGIACSYKHNPLLDVCVTWKTNFSDIKNTAIIWKDYEKSRDLSLSSDYYHPNSKQTWPRFHERL